jgi:signal peptidase I
MDNQNQTPAAGGQSPYGPDGITAGSPQPTPPPAPQPAPPAPAPAPAPTPMPASSTPSPSEPESGSSPLASIAGGFTTVLGALFSWVIFPIAVVLILHNFVFQAYHVLGTSMVPTLHNADYLIISKIGYTSALIKRALGQNAVYIPDRGEIIVFRYPKDPSEVFVKRVIGIPGDRVVVKDGKVTVYNTEHPGGYNPDVGYEANDTATFGNVDETVQPGFVFVVGDNRAPGGSYDSREWGELPSSYIIGDAVLRLLPLDQVKVL